MSFWSYDFVVNGVRYTGRIYGKRRSDIRSELKKRYRIKLPSGLKLINRGQSAKASTDE